LTYGVAYGPFAGIDPIWTIGPIVLALLVGAFYYRRARTVAAEGQPVPGWRRNCFFAGIAVIVVAVAPPLSTLSQQLLLAHMVAHVMLGDIAALLLVLGLTVPLIAPLLRVRAISRLLVLTKPAVAIACWAVNFYFWHWPTIYTLALRHQALHALEHASFVVFGSCMWMALLGPLPKPAWFGNSARLVYIIAVRLIGTVLANVLIFGGTVFYPYYRAGDAYWQIKPLADQIYAGAAMMFEESILTILLFGWLFMKVAGEIEERHRLLEYAGIHGIDLSEQGAASAVSSGRTEELWARLRGSSDEEPTPASAPGA
jgi:cytochrome c oxidase assembly factor CtaG